MLTCPPFRTMEFNALGPATVLALLMAGECWYVGAAPIVEVKVGLDLQKPVAHTGDNYICATMDCESHDEPV
jgi:hypothetical protein